MWENVDATFPNNIVKVIADATEALNTPGDPDGIYVTKRPLRSSDPKLSAGVFASQWMPNEDSYEMGNALGGYRQDATLNQYIISLQALVMDMDELQGLARHSVFAKTLRDMLLRNPTVGVALSTLSTTGTDGLTERVGRRWVRTQRYISNEISGSFIYLATLEFTIETETS